MRKRLTACLLALCLLLALLPEQTFAAEKTLTPSQNMLEAMLNGERRWVIETLVEDNREHNPLAIARGMKNRPSKAQEALDHYRGIEEGGPEQLTAYKVMVDAMYLVYDKEEIIKGFFDLDWKLRAWAVDLALDAAGLEAIATDLVATRKEMQYDGLLKDIFTEEYKASDGSTILDMEASFEILKQVQAAVKLCKSLIKVAQEKIDSEVEIEKKGEFTAAYISDHLLPYQEAAEDALEAYDELIKLSAGKPTDSGEAQKWLDIIGERAPQLISSLAMVAQKESVWPTLATDSVSYKSILEECLTNSETVDLLKVVGKGFKLADGGMDNYMFLETIRSQKELIAGPVSRMSENADEVQLRSSLEFFSGLLEEQAMGPFKNWDSICLYIRDNRLMSDSVYTLMKKDMKTMLHLMEEFSSGKAIAGGTAVILISSFLADQVVGLKTMCEKNVELLMWEDILETAKRTYQEDLSRYKNAPSEQTADNVLGDLMLLQRVRLYGEKIAHDLNNAPVDAWYGAFLSNSDRDGLEKQHQYSIDALMAATAVPPFTGLTIGSNQTLTVYELDGAGLMARRDDGVFFADLPIRFSFGISGSGRLLLDEPIAIGALDMGSSGTTWVANGRLTVGEMTQTGGEIHLGPGTGLVCTGRMTLGSPKVTYAEGVSPISLVTRDLVLTGSPACRVKASGNVSAGSSAGLDELVLDGGSQTLTGALRAGRLEVTGTSLDVTGGSVTVTGSAANPASRLAGGKNILLSGGAVEGPQWNGDLSAENVGLNGVYINGSLYDRGGGAYNGTVGIHDNLSCSGTSSIGEGGVMSVYGSASLQKSLEGGGQLDVSGDLSAASGITVAPTLCFTGAVPQEVSGSFTAGTVRFAKTGSTITVRDTLTVTGRLENPTGTVRTLSPVYLGDAAVLSGNFTGSLSVLNQDLGADKAIGGDLTLREGGTLTGTAASVAGRLILAGAGTVDGCAMTVGGLTSPTSLSLENGGSVTVRGDASLGGKLENPSELPVLGDLTLSGLTASGPLRARGDVIVSGTTALHELTLDGSLVQQITGSDFTVGDLNIHNTSGRALKLAQTITVTGRYDNPSTPIQGGAVRGGLGAPEEGVTEKTEIRGGLTQSEPLVVTGTELVIHGPVSVPSITLVNAQLTVDGNLTLTGSTPGSMDSGSTLTVRGELRTTASAGTLTLEGAADVRGDLLLGKVKLTGGNLTLGGDLYGADVQTQRLTLDGLVRQRIAADSMRTGDLTLKNTAKGGVVLEKPLHYTGTMDRGGTVLFQESNLVKEAS